MGRPRTLPPIQPRDEFNRLTALCIDERQNGREHWLFQCVCGRIMSMYVHNVRRGNSRSCGCLREDTPNSGWMRVRHGESSPPTAEWNAWAAMMSRCYILSAGNYGRYGGAGITVYESWHVYENFLDYMGRMPESGMSPDRYPNGEGDYEPGNVRWATKRQQAQNRKTNHLLTIGDRTQCLVEWIRESGIAEGTVYGRIRRGWPTERLFEPPKTQLATN